LTAGDFYRPAHVHIFDVIVALAAQAEAVDPVTVADELRRRGLLEDCGGPGELVALQANTPAISGASRYATIVAGHSTRRRLIAAGGELAELGYANTEIEETVDRAEQMVLDVTTGRVDDTRSVPVADLLAERMSYYEQLAVAGEPSGLKFGWVDMDNYMPPMKPGQLVVVGGRPSMGKSAFALNMASHVAYEQGAPVLFVSLEMTKEELTDRLLSAYGRVEGRRISTGKLQERDWGRLADAMSVGTVGRRHERGRVEPQPGDRRHAGADDVPDRG
jgi:replicative DNA helicase